VLALLLPAGQLPEWECVNDPPRGDSGTDPDDGGRGGPHLFGGRTAPVPVAAGSPERLNGQAAPEAATDASAS
jgi:hypothetical protein